MFRTQKDHRDPKFHSFVITREDGSRTYGFTYTFYEEVLNKQICTAMQALHAMHLAELANSQSRTLLRHPSRESSRDREDSEGRHTLPKAHRSSPQNVNPVPFYDIQKDTLYVTKCMCIISQLPFVSAARKVLKSIYKAVCSSKGPPMPIESYLYNILYEVPLPPVGRSLKFSCLEGDVLCIRPGKCNYFHQDCFDFS